MGCMNRFRRICNWQQNQVGIMAPTPKFFKTLRTIGLVIGLAGGAILASPVVLPAAIVTIGGYLALAGSIVTGVSQTVVGKE